MALSTEREREILRLAHEGGDDLTAAMAKGGKALVDFQEQIRREILDFVRTNRNKEELHLFAINWHWGGGVGLAPIHELINNPHVDPGTLLALFWNSAPEDYYMDFASPDETDGDFEAEVYQTMLDIERKYETCDRSSATIAFNPSGYAGPTGRRASVARRISEVMYQPVGPKKG